MPKAAKPSRNRIGTEREWSLHRALKLSYTGPGGAVEVSRGDYVCDGVTPQGEVIEVQTGSFGPLKEKVKALNLLGPVRIIHPIIIRKYIELYDTQGKAIRKRRLSPRKGSPWDLFKALLYAPELPTLPGLSIELALVDVLELRVLDGKGSWRRKGASITDKLPLQYHETIVLSSIRDYRRFLPFKAGESFTVKTLGEKAGISTDIAGKALYVLTSLKAVERIGKSGRAWVYQTSKALGPPRKTARKNLAATGKSGHT
jgi:hypothetical protein